VGWRRGGAQRSRGASGKFCAPRLPSPTREKLKTAGGPEWGSRGDQRSLADRRASPVCSQEGPLIPALRAPEEQRPAAGEDGHHAAGIDREIVELLHRTHHGVEIRPDSPVAWAMKAALADGWGGSMIATDVQGRAFRTGPQAIRSQANLGVLEERQVNILVHGHEPILSEMIVAASREADLLALAAAGGRRGHQHRRDLLHGQPRSLMRQGMPVAGNYLHQELALLTGAVDLMVVDVAMRHAFPAPGGGVPSHQGSNHFLQGPHSRCGADDARLSITRRKPRGPL